VQLTAVSFMKKEIKIGKLEQSTKIGKFKIQDHPSIYSKQSHMQKIERTTKKNGMDE
jgi:hypothetical protein